MRGGAGVEPRRSQAACQRARAPLTTPRLAATVRPLAAAAISAARETSVKRLSVATACLLASTTASAARFGLDPQNRLHAGLSMVNSDFKPGINAGLDSRLSRVLYVDVGGFFTTTDDSGRAAPESVDSAADYFELRHGLYVAPGLRVPHRYGEGLNWDLTGRAGFGAVWSTDASSDYALHADPALLVGGDLLLRYEQVGLRFGGKLFGYDAFATGPRQQTGVLRPQYFIEGVIQW